MRKFYVSLGVILMLYSCKTDSPPFSSKADPEVKTGTEIDGLIRKSLDKNGKFEWGNTDDVVIWSAGQLTDQIYAVGYQPKDERLVENRLHEIDINSKPWQDTKKQILEIIWEEERVANPSLKLEQLEVWEENFLPVIDVTIKRFSTIQRLRASGLVRYVEPMGYDAGVTEKNVQRVTSSSGCGSNVAQSGLVNGTHYTVTTPNTLVSWNYQYHRIPQAWSKSTGRGIKVYIIDTGTSPDQDNLGSAFNQGSSSGRTIEKIVTLPRNTFLGIPTGSVETPADLCGHGTSMAGACAAPRGIDGAMTGVAYNCNLVTCRAAADVLIDESRENKGVSDAFVNAGNRSDVRIISMSMGRITSNSQIADAVRYAYGKGKLIFCAGGTSFGWSADWYGVIFPAYMPEVQAVTGVIEGTNFTNCNECHKGSEIDFVVTMQRSADGFKPLTLAMSGNPPATVGGSSVATATTAGIAALVWSKYPTSTRDQILSRLQQNSSRFPTKSAEYGWGLINADLATN
jgi:subtilisin family serine protease